MDKEDLALAKLILKSYVYTFLEKVQLKSNLAQLKVFVSVVATYITATLSATVLVSRDKK